ncbi:class I SAM-dependent methyltransferase [Desulfobacca acetoxidans]|uniref:Methyltransferase-16 n=1 Tax=Desulfobacca acetoxidans (strain ATCC 700848 / DSM 11109 / ASRB2) TaxID=880072 RepID=F2NC73_DESAR|nr:methyltransferase [Desulfobacca acetoxidans]AEB08868.1 Methyltransferase-16 [Desulfobacca acetoxidans DSM 11109]
MISAAVSKTLWEELSQRYQLEWADIQVGSVKLKILQLQNLEGYLVSNIEANALSMGNFPYWAMVWDAALVLADFLVRQEPQPAREILEIGAGLGFVGLCAGRRGHRITLTDNMPDALNFARLSVYHNNLTNVAVEFLDWTKPTLTGRYDWIVGSDILYEEKTFASLGNIFATYLKPQGKIYITQGIRGLGPKIFFEMMRSNYSVRYQEKKLGSKEGDKKILFFEMQAKQP